MEIQFQHHHVLTFCDQNKENFSHILLKFFKPDERNRKKLDDEEDYEELEDEEDYEELEVAESTPKPSRSQKLEIFLFRASSEHPICLVCFRIICNGPVYFCEMCDGIWVHKFCASLPREIRAHPVHLQHHHSLTLRTTTNFRFYHGGYNCDCCGDIIRIPNYYRCSECGLKLDCKCALSPDNDDLQQITLSLDTKTQISHDSHRHTLFLVNSRSRKKLTTRTCSLCEREIVDLAYCCVHCDFYLHKRCVEISQQECEVQHPCHSHHPVSIQYHSEKFICDKCRDMCSGSFVAICKKCDFKIDFKCAFFRNTTIQKSIGDEVKTQIRYFNHDLHLLSFFNCTRNINLRCEGCLLQLSGPSYGCVECSVYLHKSCAELPRMIQHPYDPFHNLFLENSNGYCRACGNVAESLRYRCLLCPSFLLDAKCVINNLGVISALKNKEYHQHDLYYFMAPNWFYGIKFKCNICRKERGGSFYICLECRYYFHMECIGIPKEVKHDSHIHPLTLVDPLTEDNVDKSKDKYYCYTCENERNPRHHTYSCQQCVDAGYIFTAHIECVLSSELNEIEHNHMTKDDDEEDSDHEKFPNLDKLSISPRCMKQLLIKDKFNDHILNYIQDIPSFSCYLCDDEFEESPCYKCSFCQIHLHKECAKLAFKIQHNFHEHPLSIHGGEFLKRFICDGCQVYHESDMCYHCEECSFYLDRMCAQGNHYRKLNDNGSKVGFSHFSHKHELRFVFIIEKLKVDCLACQLLISGPTYCCYACDFFLHESCFDELKPQYIQHPFHIQHPLHFKGRMVLCKVCKTSSNIGYECAECNFELDIKCVKYLTSGLQYECHEHKLFCFAVEDITDSKYLYWCKHCDQLCDAFFYRCLNCNINLHIECMSIPKNVKSVCHVHPLTLMDSTNEEGQDEYYCYACENLRNPKHAAYNCKKCYYTAHIGCVLDEEEGEIEIL